MKTREPKKEESEWVTIPAWLKEWKVFVPERTGVRMLNFNMN